MTGVRLASVETMRKCAGCPGRSPPSRRVRERRAAGAQAQQLEGIPGRDRCELDAAPVVGAQHVHRPHRQGRGVEPLRRNRVFLDPRAHRLPCLPPPAQRIERVRPQVDAGEGGQRFRAPAPVRDHRRRCVGQHRMAARHQRREQRRLADAGATHEQHRPRLRRDGGRAKRDHTTLLQQRNEDRAREEVAHVAVAAAARLDRDVASAGDEIARHPVHVQHEAARSGLPHDAADPCARRRRERRGRLAEADRDVRLVVRAALAVRHAGKGNEGQRQGRAHPQPVRRVVVHGVASGCGAPCKCASIRSASASSRKGREGRATRKTGARFATAAAMRKCPDRCPSAAT